MALTPDPAAVKEELLKQFPAKVARKRAKHIVETEGEAGQEIAANVRTIPGVISQRGCTYAGCKGVILGPTRDVLSITHGPIGCGYYSWLTRRNQTRTESDTDPNYMTYSLSTDMQEENIVFGGEAKLKDAIREAYATFKPPAIAIHSTCPVGLIGDDVHAVAREMKEELGINVFGFSCEGYRGVSQSAGHHIANNKIFTEVVSHEAPTQHFPVPEGKFKINLLGEYNIGGDAFVLEELFERCGISLVSTFCGNSTYESLAQARHVDLNLVMCHRSINYVATMLETSYGIPWAKVNFIGANQTAKSLRKVAAFFDDAELTAKVEQVIAEEMVKVDAAKSSIVPRTAGKSVMLFVGGSRAHHYQHLFKEIDMKILAAGYEFAHRDDYEGRDVIPNIKIDADNRNIEEIEVHKAEALYNDRSSPEAEERLKAIDGEGFAEYNGMMPEMEAGVLAIDDVSHYETEKLIELYKPDMVCCGIKEKYSIQKNGVASRQLHSYDYGGPYAGFAGAINFWKDIDMMVNARWWKLVKAPWDMPEDASAAEARMVTLS
ncbi:MAG: nitrogenase molybdenum-iron protein alpha chain [Planctomycetota bacterium]|jgi:nitrogenase molybdenum-iron protein alpha chain|nr:nitrogenase molybdenum-iron protein alpha chain [Planctomycetota bacterium]